METQPGVQLEQWAGKKWQPPAYYVSLEQIYIQEGHEALTHGQWIELCYWQARQTSQGDELKFAQIIQDQAPNIYYWNDRV